MPATYEPIATTTLSSTQTTVTFNSIPSTYTDLVVASNSLTSGNTTGGLIRFNGDSSSLYSERFFYGVGTGSTASSYNTNQTSMSAQFGRTTPSPFIMHILNYSNTTTNKTCLIRMNNASYAVWLSVGLYRSTSAISSVSLECGGSTWASGATFTVYGIKAA